MIPRDLEKLQAARVWAVTRQPYLAIALHSLQLRWTDGYGTFGVDRWWRLYADPACVDEWTVLEIGAVLLHEVWHLLRDHHARADALGSARDLEAWNFAADAEINDDLVQAGLPLPGSPILPRDLRRPDGLLAEEYYRTSVPRAKSRLPLVDCGSGADAVERDHEDGAPSEESHGLTTTQAEIVRTTCAQAITDAARARGDVPDGWQRWAEQALTATVDWRAVLAAQVRRALTSTAGAVDYSWSRPSRRSVPGVVLPSLRRPVPVVAVVVDTSGSVDDEMLGQALAEIDGALSGAGARCGDVTVLSCDTEVARSQRVKSARQVRLAGGGGTDMRVGMAAATSLRPHPDVVIVLTDGDTPWPEDPPRRTRVVVGLLAETQVETPPWARVVKCHD